MQHKHYILNKPPGFLSQFTYDFKKKNKRLLGELYDFHENTMSIGRLDEPSEGLLLLTTDGKVSHLVRSRHYEKEYYAQVDGIITSSAIAAMQEGMPISINGKIYHTLPCKAHALEQPPNLPLGKKKLRDDRHGPTSWVSITLTEGKFRQVRKMTAAAGFPTLRLVRVRIGNILLGDLAPGAVKEVEDLQEVL